MTDTTVTQGTDQAPPLPATAAEARVRRDEITRDPAARAFQLIFLWGFGLLVLGYMLIVKPAGTLNVTYERRAPSAESPSRHFIKDYKVF